MSKEPVKMSDVIGQIERELEQAQAQARAKFPYLAGELERLYKLGAAGSILELMEATWTNHGELGEPYSDLAAIEIAINELIDYARERGCRVTWQNEEIGSPHGLCAHPPEEES